MMLLDANILIYAHNSLAQQHQRTKQWLQSALDSAEPIALSWVTLLAFLRIMTDPRTFIDPLPIEDASGIAAVWLGHPAVSMLNPTDRHWPILKRLTEESQSRGPLVMDAHLAALAIEHGATLCTTDRDFTRFKGLRLVNPLE
jgi:uncharacterized protein